jgi:hypothetical protein
MRTTHAFLATVVASLSVSIVLGAMTLGQHPSDDGARVAQTAPGVPSPQPSTPIYPSPAPGLPGSPPGTNPATPNPGNNPNPGANPGANPGSPGNAPGMNPGAGHGTPGYP